MLLELSTSTLQEIADALILKRITGIKSAEADKALQEFQTAIQVAQVPKSAKTPT